MRSSLALQCKLDILFLRKDGLGSLVTNAGDLDNRIKILFDGLRMPITDAEMSKMPKIDLSKPFYTFLEDDILISGFSVTTDRLLSKLNSEKDDVLLVIDVLVTPSMITSQNLVFIND